MRQKTTTEDWGAGSEVQPRIARHTGVEEALKLKQQRPNGASTHTLAMAQQRRTQFCPCWFPALRQQLLRPSQEMMDETPAFYFSTFKSQDALALPCPALPQMQML